MATSGSYDYKQNRDSIIKDALMDLGVVSQEDVPTAAVNEHAARQLNLMLKAWQSKGLRLWKTQRATVLLQQGDDTYNLGPTGSAFCLDSELIKTTVATAIVGAGIGSIDITVDSSSGMSDSDYIAIRLDDGSLYFTTIDTVVDPVTVTITDDLVSGATAAVGNVVYAFTTKAERPLEILQAFARDETQSPTPDRPVRLVSRDEYESYSDKFAASQVITIYYEPTLINGTLKVYSPQQLCNETLRLIVQYPFEDMDAAANDFDFPVEWLMAIKFNLALALAPSYGAQSTTLKTIAALAESYLDDAMSFDKEHVNIQLTPEYNWSNY